MGEDFIGKSHRQFSRLIDAVREEQFKQRDLFTEAVPTSVTEVYGLVLDDTELAAGQELFHVVQLGEAPRLVFYRGANPVLELSGDAAALALEEGGADFVTATVVAVTPENGCARLAIHKPTAENDEPSERT